MNKSYKYEEEKKNALENLRLAVWRCIQSGISKAQIANVIMRIFNDKQSH